MPPKKQHKKFNKIKLKKKIQHQKKSKPKKQGRFKFHKTGPKKSEKKPHFKKAPKKEIVPVIEPVFEPTDEEISSLISKGRTRDFLTEEEILYVFKNVEDYLDKFEGFLDDIERHGVMIETRDNGVLDEVALEQSNANKPHKRGEEKIDLRKLDLTDISSDSIQMYLREIGKVPLLS